MAGMRLQSTHASVYAGDFAANESVQKPNRIFQFRNDLCNDNGDRNLAVDK